MNIIGDAWSSSGKAPIILSRGFNIETLTGVSPLWKIEYPDGCSTAIRYIVRKVTAVEGGLV